MFKHPAAPRDSYLGPVFFAPAIPLIGLAIAAIGTAASVYSGFQGAAAQRAQASYQSKVADNNTVLADRAAKDAIKRGQIAEDASRRKTAALIGTQRATLAGNGVLVDSGSALDITTDTKGIGELDALTIRDNANREAAGYRAQGANFQAQGAIAQMQGDQASGFNGIGDALGGLGSVASKWYELSKSSATTPVSGNSDYNYGGAEFMGTGSSY